ncbi:hypothetical protein [Mobilicoccus pelagius]|uniref:CobW/HypB/UreG nucleotide-binding domain-containing protein n=1 Tax=Mobilicoccus pelagius NBRC 104925 TaxID=1089455 RepID=H5UNY0_9MICO|nr:hypothetical protein [Mobilicoccus pelagius]GAB47438.1 hypothetical protein MOPEL_011_00200 [Mobilicoccus pelagius NBRC 104925]
MTPVVTCCSTDEVLRESLTAGLLLDLPGAVVVLHDLDPVAGTLRRLVHDAERTWEDRIEPLAHTCLGCALREDIVPAIREVAFRRPTAIVLALPVTAEPVPVLEALVGLAEEGIVDIGGVLAASPPGISPGTCAVTTCSESVGSPSRRTTTAAWGR